MTVITVPVPSSNVISAVFPAASVCSVLAFEITILVSGELVVLTMTLLVPLPDHLPLLVAAVAIILHERVSTLFVAAGFGLLSAQRVGPLVLHTALLVAASLRILAMQSIGALVFHTARAVDTACLAGGMLPETATAAADPFRGMPSAPSFVASGSPLLLLLLV
jgi:hypothetical protein